MKKKVISWLSVIVGTAMVVSSLIGMIVANV